MLAFRVRYLLGRVAAADVSRGSEKDRSEWPPHPDRLYSALVQAWADLGQPNRERTFLQRLASAPAPRVHAQRAANDVGRVSFVPVPDNWKPYYRDPNTKKEKAFTVMGAMRIGRDRKERRFVSHAVELDLVEPHATIAWPQPVDGTAWTSEDLECAANLSRLVGYLGHSSSLVGVDVGDEVATVGWRTVDGEEVWRWPLWSGSFGVQVIASILASGDLWRDDPESRRRLRTRGVFAVYQTRRLTVGRAPNQKFNLSPAVPVWASTPDVRARDD